MVTASIRPLHEPTLRGTPSDPALRRSGRSASAPIGLASLPRTFGPSCADDVSDRRDAGVIDYVTDTDRWDDWMHEYRFGACYIFPPDEVIEPIDALRKTHDP